MKLWPHGWYHCRSIKLLKIRSIHFSYTSAAATTTRTLPHLYFSFLLSIKLYRLCCARRVKLFLLPAFGIYMYEYIISIRDCKVHIIIIFLLMFLFLFFNGKYRRYLNGVRICNEITKITQYLFSRFLGNNASIFRTTSWKFSLALITSSTQSIYWYLNYSDGISINSSPQNAKRLRNNMRANFSFSFAYAESINKDSNELLCNDLAIISRTKNESDSTNCERPAH